ncbi:hypothetical protein B6H63_00955 [Campylobacter coli]|uniref:Uncharacterized protein n=1 Tax=Campylobacter coli TaxID=195 RepID=A0A644SAT1_CAMCO|nr:hypothetical protein [Campylobacter coli]EAH7177200.1 hypothetical protein [Campylobacter coli]EAH7505904.1 hypothetical protein [Campylobacter coli]EAH8899677.1 hypothetical protein [Campylobacter coli]EAI3228502.1 hypothetical protein [Campylobacter coli]
MFLFGLYIFAREIYKMANIKRIYITKEKLVIEYYIKNDLIFPLGTFLCIIVVRHLHLVQEI